MTEGREKPQDGRSPSGVIPLHLMRERQHGAARIVAEGGSARDVAAYLGVPLARAMALLERPAMLELIAHYRRAA